jgi:hypothetical protein
MYQTLYLLFHVTKETHDVRIYDFFQRTKFGNRCGYKGRDFKGRVVNSESRNLFLSHRDIPPGNPRIPLQSHCALSPSVTAVYAGVINNLYRPHHRGPTSPLLIRYRVPQNVWPFV